MIEPLDRVDISMYGRRRSSVLNVTINLLLERDRPLIFFASRSQFGARLANILWLRRLLVRRGVAPSLSIAINALPIYLSRAAPLCFCSTFDKLAKPRLSQILGDIRQYRQLVRPLVCILTAEDSGKPIESGRSCQKYRAISSSSPLANRPSRPRPSPLARRQRCLSQKSC